MHKEFVSTFMSQRKLFGDNLIFIRRGHNKQYQPQSEDQQNNYSFFSVGFFCLMALFAVMNDIINIIIMFCPYKSGTLVPLTSTIHRKFIDCILPFVMNHMRIKKNNTVKLNYVEIEYYGHDMSQYSK